MTDWADGIADRNYGIKCRIDTGMLMELICALLAFSAVAGALLFFSWVRSQSVNIGYESQNFSAIEESLLRTHKRLILEEEILGNPERIDKIARIELGMAPLRPGQLIRHQIQAAGSDASDSMVMASSGAMRFTPAAPMRSSAIGSFR
jgi:cell division protein FtsL